MNACARRILMSLCARRIGAQNTGRRAMSRSRIPVIDLFAGPGGLNEGFAQVRDGQESVFDLIGSFEVAPEACRTLHLRAYYRTLLRNDDAKGLDRYLRFVRGELTPDQLAVGQGLAELWDETEVTPSRLGEDTRSESSERVRKALYPYLPRGTGHADNLVVIGGPPCQAYSLAGRSRRAHDESFAEDEKHFLYQEYLHFISEFRPAVFVMENVQGLLTARNVSRENGQATFSDQSDRIVRQIFRDLRHPAKGAEYVLRPLVDDGEEPSSMDFVVNMSEHGVPEARRRLIVLGIRKDLADSLGERLHLSLPKDARMRTVREALSGLPRIRSGISRGEDSWDEWLRLRERGRTIFSDQHASFGPLPEDMPYLSDPGRGSAFVGGVSADWPFSDELYSRPLGGLAQHESRAHMAEDLLRYEYYALHARYLQSGLKVGDLPSSLLPDHKNVREAKQKSSIPFADRFRVQRWDRPSSTVTSHISKDGHAFIHPDAAQMRSLTVREAARLQTFPDDFVFCGNRTQQYHQVGNAVPPLMARRIGDLVRQLLEA